MLVQPDGTIAVPEREYWRMKGAQDTLQALYNGGVDSWEGYDEAMAYLRGRDG